MIRKHQTARFDRPSLYVPDTPRLLEDVVCTLLEKDPDDRIADAHIVMLRLREVVRRVELATQDRTSVSESRDLMAPTATALDEFQEAETKPAIADGPSPGTMMRDLFRAEIDRQEAVRSPISRAFDNTWVLVGCLVLLIAGGIWWFKFFDSSSQDVTPVADSRSEIERLQHMARSYRRMGDYGREAEILTGIRSLIAHDESLKAEVGKIDRRLKQLQKNRKRQSKDFAAVQSAIQRAEELIEQGETRQAESILSGILLLYGSEEAAASHVEKARMLLQQKLLPQSETQAGE